MEGTREVNSSLMGAGSVAATGAAAVAGDKKSEENKEVTNSPSEKVSVKAREVVRYDSVQEYHTVVKAVKENLEQVKAKVEDIKRHITGGCVGAYEKYFDNFERKHAIKGNMNVAAQKLELPDNKLYMDIEVPGVRKNLREISDILDPKETEMGFFNESWKRSIELKDKKHFENVEIAPIFTGDVVTKDDDGNDVRGEEKVLKIRRDTNVFFKLTDLSKRPTIRTREFAESDADEHNLTKANLFINDKKYKISDGITVKKAVENLNAKFVQEAEALGEKEPRVKIEFDADNKRYNFIGRDFGPTSELKIKQVLADPDGYGLFSNITMADGEEMVFEARGQMGIAEVTLENDIPSRTRKKFFSSDVNNVFKDVEGNVIAMKKGDFPELLNENVEIARIKIPLIKFSGDIKGVEAPLLSIKPHEIGYREEDRKSLMDVNILSISRGEQSKPILERSLEDIDKYIEQVNEIDERNKSTIPALMPEDKRVELEKAEVSVDEAAGVVHDANPRNAMELMA